MESSAAGPRVSAADARDDIQLDDPGGSLAMAERPVRSDAEQPRPERIVVSEAAAMVERREQAVRDDVLGGGPVADDEVGDGLHVPAVPGEQVGQYLGSSPTQRLDRHVDPPVGPGDCAPAGPVSQGRYPAPPKRVSPVTKLPAVAVAGLAGPRIGS